MQLKSLILKRSIPVPESGCWIWAGATINSGYGKLSFKGKTYTAHRASFASFNGEIPSGKCVLHRCDVRLCVNPDHLFVGDRVDNMRDMIKKGRGKWPGKKGEKNGNSVLNSDDVVLIRQKHAQGRQAS